VSLVAVLVLWEYPIVGVGLSVFRGAQRVVIAVWLFVMRGSAVCLEVG
jgi:hypothetical protein